MHLSYLIGKSIILLSDKYLRWIDFSKMFFFYVLETLRI